MCMQVRCLLAAMSLTVILAWPLATSVRAEELPAGHGQVTGDRIPFQAKAEVPALTPEQWRSLHEQSLTGTHLPGPRLPAGPDGQSQSATPLPPPTTGRPGPAVAPLGGAAA